MVTVQSDAPTGEPTPPDPQAAPVRDGDGPQPNPNEPVVFEEAEAADPDTSLADPAVGQTL